MRGRKHQKLKPFCELIAYKSHRMENEFGATLMIRIRTLRICQDLISKVSYLTSSALQHFIRLCSHSLCFTFRSHLYFSWFAPYFYSSFFFFSFGRLRFAVVCCTYSKFVKEINTPASIQHTAQQRNYLQC